MNEYTIDSIVVISISCKMNNYTTCCAARELHMRAPLAGLPLVCREYLKEASRCTIQVACYIALYYPLVAASVSGKTAANVYNGVVHRYGLKESRPGFDDLTS
jgi:hypothetical protein